MISNPIKSMGVLSSTPAEAPKAAAGCLPTCFPGANCCCSAPVAGTEDLSKYGMLPNNKRKCRDMFCCSFFLVFCECQFSVPRSHLLKHSLLRQPVCHPLCHVLT
jgi:hypothetical protein